jgi:hypothetical protein
MGWDSGHVDPAFDSFVTSPELEGQNIIRSALAPLDNQGSDDILSKALVPGCGRVCRLATCHPFVVNDIIYLYLGL